MEDNHLAPPPTFVEFAAAWAGQDTNAHKHNLVNWFLGIGLTTTSTANMPALPGLAGRHRRKGATPIVAPDRAAIWERTLEFLGYESLNESEQIIASLPSTNVVRKTTEATGGSSSGSGKEVTQWQTLPVELQKKIIGYTTNTDLLSLCLVSKHFREIAAEHLYRTFHVLFPDDDGIYSDPFPTDALAAGFDTLVGSDYNYAAHLREIILESLSLGGKGEQAYRFYQYDEGGCTKFLNTLLHLTLKKAKALETFKWDVRVELSREVFKTLQSIQALQHVHLRMQVGESMYLPLPPPVNALQPPPGPPPPPGPGPHHNIVMLPPPMPPMPPAFLPSNSPTNFASGVKMSAKSFQKSLNSKLPNADQDPPKTQTFSGFKNLKSLSVLDMDTYDYIDELKTCLQNSSATLTSLQLSFSETLANRSRKPPPEVHSDDESDAETDFGQPIPLNPPPPPPGASDPNGTSKTIKAQEEKKKQEAVLGKIFGITPTILKTKPVQHTGPFTDVAPEVDPKKRFIRSLASISQKLMKQMTNPNSSNADKMVAVILEASKTYLQDEEKLKKATNFAEAGEGTSGTGVPNPSDDADVEDEAVMSGGAGPSNISDGPGLFDSPKIKKKKDASTETGVSNPDDIDIEEPEGDDQTLDSEIVSEARDFSTKTPPKDDVVASSSSSSSNTDNDLLRSVNKSTAPGSNGLGANESDKMSQYIRDTRGLTLSSLAINHIPIKPSVLGRAIDFSVLQSLTLLNVGPQVSLWNMLNRENSLKELPLRKIYTDNVTFQFLAFAYNLTEIEELYLLERNAKARVESTAPKTSVTIDQIRKIVLKKHVNNLKVLMIRNNASTSWDLNVKTMELLCRSATKLEELAGSFGTSTMHVLLQKWHGMKSLRAQHTIQFRTDDTCMWVMREFRRYFVDMIAVRPGYPLEYLALDNNVERIVRKRPKAQSAPKEPQKKDTKGKGKAVDTDLLMVGELVLGPINSWPDGTLSVSGLTGLATSLPLGGVPSDWQDTSEDEESVQPFPKLELMEGVRFTDVVGVKIFSKEVLGGRL